MPRRREVGRHSSLPPVPQLEPTTKPASVTAVIRRLVILDQTANAKALEARLTEAGFPGTKLSTITTIRADALATLREAAALGLLRTRRSRFLSRPMPGLAGRGRRVGRLRSRKPPPSDPPQKPNKNLRSPDSARRFCCRYVLTVRKVRLGSSVEGRDAARRLGKFSAPAKIAERQARILGSGGCGSAAIQTERP